MSDGSRKHFGMKAIQAIKRPLTAEQYAEVHRTLLEAEKPFVEALAKLYSFGVSAVIVLPDFSIEPVDPYLNLPPELKKQVDETQKLRREVQESVLRSCGIDPAEVDQQQRPML